MDAPGCKEREQCDSNPESIVHALQRMEEGEHGLRMVDESDVDDDGEEDDVDTMEYNDEFDEMEEVLASGALTVSNDSQSRNVQL